jgi:hypothetical protein
MRRPISDTTMSAEMSTGFSMMGCVLSMLRLTSTSSATLMPTAESSNAEAPATTAITHAGWSGWRAFEIAWLMPSRIAPMVWHFRSQ